MSIKYNSVLLSVNESVFERRCKMQTSRVVSKIPPSCLKALLENRNGVLPGTTSMDNHNFLPVTELASGICILHTLVRD